MYKRAEFIFILIISQKWKIRVLLAGLLFRIYHNMPERQNYFHFFGGWVVCVIFIFRSFQIVSFFKVLDVFLFY